MHLREIRDLFAYNAWANNRVFELVAKVPADQYMQDMKTSHGSLHGTLTHLIGAEKVWLERWQRKTDIVFTKEKDTSSFAELRAIWDKVDADRSKLLSALTEQNLNDTVPVVTSKGDTFNNTFAQMMQHMVNHSTYHRGQAVAIIRQLGFPAIGTDMITYFRR